MRVLFVLQFFILLLSRVGATERVERDFTVWEPEIEAFERSDAKSPPGQDGILFVGSSSIRLWDLDKYFPEYQFINRGFGGSHIVDSIYFADRIILKYRPRTIVFYAGDNDITDGKSPEQVENDFRRLVDVIHKQLPRTRIAFIAIKPSINRWKLADRMKMANNLIAECCRKDDRLSFVDIWKPMLGKDGQPRSELFAEDGLHLSHAGYQLWTKLVAPHVQDK